jgi:hypothetical protein
MSDLNYQLGVYVGEVIEFRYLPTLSTDMLKTRNVVEVSPEDAERHRIVSEALSKTYKFNGGDGDGKKEFEVYKALNHELARKYLPEKLQCMVPHIRPTDMKQFLKGLQDQIWGTDRSWYWPEEDFYTKGHEGGHSDYIVLTLKIND